jgi:hypothetical protein
MSLVEPQLNSIEQSFNKTKGLLLAETAPEYTNDSKLYGPLQPNPTGEGFGDYQWNPQTCQLIRVWFGFSFPLPDYSGILEIFVNQQATEIMYVHTYPYVINAATSETSSTFSVPNPPPSAGCWQMISPSTTWQQVSCGTAPLVPLGASQTTVTAPLLPQPTNLSLLLIFAAVVLTLGLVALLLLKLKKDKPI